MIDRDINVPAPARAFIFSAANARPLPRKPSGELSYE